MSGSSSETSTIIHECGHAGGFAYLGFGPETIVIRPDHGQHSGSTKQRIAVTDMPRRHRIVALLCGHRAEQDDLTPALEPTLDVKFARRYIRELLDVGSDNSPE